ncbi:MAG: hypothetical protein AUJ74_04970 [Candidatus Omnitrophica bacterium CG1_02_44_16]|nr:MAG: hypothetical protein AUJ74_04970 [Candidatus Omnitrophica bacterium CG1_02_44_16]PIY82052.1 MAG: hypothetical protein COY78_08425 [Candidatus Omnitrophica bacterium CG_4_10_14_0_8_um_filter_44_12]PIZ83860.1 MAG: hypothetical protein COX96_06550 [Candidatus Omnitrophica bacterium CG_4_10_14_0_2_um_filter_44_9]
MIKIDFSILICYYLCGQLILFLFFWLHDKRSVVRQRPLKDNQIWQCSTCLYVYFKSKASNISTCPVCESFNQRQN